MPAIKMSAARLVLQLIGAQGGPADDVLPAMQFAVLVKQSAFSINSSLDRLYAKYRFTI